MISLRTVEKTPKVGNLLSVNCEVAFDDDDARVSSQLFEWFVQETSQCRQVTKLMRGSEH